MEQLPLLASFFPRGEGESGRKAGSVYCLVRGWVYWESRVFVPVATQFTVCRVWGRCIFTSLLKCTFL